MCVWRIDSWLVLGIYIFIWILVCTNKSVWIAFFVSTMCWMAILFGSQWRAWNLAVMSWQGNSFVFMLAIKKSTGVVLEENLKNIVVLLNLVPGVEFEGNNFGYWWCRKDRLSVSSKHWVQTPVMGSGHHWWSVNIPFHWPKYNTFLNQSSFGWIF